MTAHEALATSAAPAWSEPTDDGSVGVDFLGTRAVNLEMLTRLTGAYNNVVVSARQHAVVCWAAWRYRENCRAAGTDPAKFQFRDFLDAIETIQLAGQRALGESVGGTSGGLGAGALNRLGDGPTITLRFKKYGRSHDNTSALAPVQYGPSAKVGSLGLLHSRSGIWWPSTRGEKLALALDPLLRKSKVYDRFATFPVPDQIALDEAIEFAGHGLVLGADLAERPERGAYIEALFDLDGEPIATDHVRRSSVTFLLTVLERLGNDCSVADLRRALLSRKDASRSPLPIPSHLEDTAAKWQLLQLRQLQRYALETWLFWAEWCMPALSNEIVGALAHALRGLASPHDNLASLLDLPSERAIASYLAHRQVTDVLGWTAGSEPGTPWALRSEIRDALDDEAPLRIAAPLLGLTMSVLALSAQLVDAKTGAGFVEIGERRRISLLHFKMWWTRQANVPLRDALVDFVEELVLQQHVAVAVARFDDEQRRLRFSNDDAGWDMLPNSKASFPQMTPDRIEALLRLCSDLALVKETSDGYTITSVGRDTVRLIEQRVAAGSSQNPP